jgi:hypothetical protein
MEAFLGQVDESTSQHYIFRIFKNDYPVFALAKNRFIQNFKNFFRREYYVVISFSIFGSRADLR